MIRSRLRMVQVWALLILVMQLYIPLTQPLLLNNVLHVPQASKNLVSVHCLAVDNHAFLEFHPYFFLIKDQATKRVLLCGRCKDGLYPLPATTIRHQALLASKPALSRWHSRLGHPSFPIAQRVISNFNLPCSREVNKDYVCDACQQGKSHQLPYTSSSSRSSFPL